eukprot:1063870-Pyramimonas_sp.AAC.1
MLVQTQEQCSALCNAMLCCVEYCVLCDALIFCGMIWRGLMRNRMYIMPCAPKGCKVQRGILRPKHDDISTGASVVRRNTQGT